MLSDQTFEAEPIIALGPEVFKDPSGFNGLDLPTVVKFRSKFCKFKQWQFMYVGLREPNDTAFLNLLSNMGVQLTSAFSIDPANPTHVDQWKAMQPLLEWVYSPALTKVLPARIDNTLDGNKELLLNCLEHYYMSMQPYTKAHFREIYKYGHI